MKRYLRSSRGEMRARSIVVGILCQLVVVPILGQARTNTTLDWAAVKSAYDNFLELPSAENAKRFLDTIPADTPNINDLSQESSFLEHFTHYRNYPIFEMEIWAGSADATRAAFRLLNLIHSAGHSEIINNTLSHLIRMNARLFLGILSEYKSNSRIMLFHSNLIMSTFSAYVDRFSAIKHEWRMRIMALKKVKDSRYITLRNTCIKILQEGINELPDISDRPIKDELPDY